ncbi:Uncharacterised protein [Klebsiella aerogenes]|nr:Uncharacterised protein [Klebsiella aerogenes]
MKQITLSDMQQQSEAAASARACVPIAIFILN